MGIVTNQLEPSTAFGRIRSVLRHSSVAVMGAALVASVVAFGRDVLVGRALGLGSDLDAWTLTLAIIAFGTTSFITASSASIVPRYRKASAGKLEFRPEEVASAAVTAAVLVGLAIGIMTLIAAETISILLGETSRTSDSIVMLIQVLALTAIPSLLVRGAGGAVLQSSGHFAVPAVGPAIPALCVIVAVGVADVSNLEPLGWVHGAGLLVEALLLILLIARWGGLGTRDMFRWLDVVRTLRRGVGPAFLSAVAFSINPIIDLGVAAKLGAGEAGRLGLAGRLTLALAALAATSIVVPAFPRFVDALTVGGPSALWARLKRALSLGVVAGAAITVLLLITSIPLARVMFAGSEVSSSEARSIGTLQMTYAATATPYIAAGIALRALHALEQYRWAMYIAVVGSTLNLVADIALSQLLGVHGIAAATSLVYVVTSGAMTWRVLTIGRSAGGSAAR